LLAEVFMLLLRIARVPWFAALSILAVAGCDPKLTGPPTPGGGPTDEPDLVVTAEAQAVGNILALHAEILRAGRAVAVDFDSASTATIARGIMPEGCWALTEATTPYRWGLRFDGCIDAHGTEYRGGGQFEGSSEFDGYVFSPWYDVDLLRATNSEDDNYNHDIHSGTLAIEFAREAGVVTAVHLTNFLRHGVRAEIVTFTYDATFTGAVGSLAEYPDGGSTGRIVWDSVGIFDVAFSGGATATYPMQGITYQVNLATGDVTAVSAL
jgi:hypothetical protein